MDAFKKKSLYLAMAAGLASVGVAGTASAVNVSTNGTGQVLIYPYYTTRADMTTLLSVVNTTASTKAVKVRFTEGKNSREVLDFNLYLSPYDVWTGAVVNTTDGAMLTTADNSCTFPKIAASGANFVNYAYTGTASVGIQHTGTDGAGTTLDRTREGYFEIIEMGVITDATIAAAIKHDASGVPANCAVVQTTAMTMGSAVGQTNPVMPPVGGLAGSASLVDVANGTDFGYDPVALSAFSTNNIWYPAGTIDPDMTKAFPVTSSVFKGGTVVTTDWASSVGDDAANAVSAVLMHNNLMNEFIVDPTLLAGTDWVITMPTKRYYVPVGSSSGAIKPFTTGFGSAGACEAMTLEYWNREESATAVSDFSPPMPGSGSNSSCLPWESTVVTFNAATTGVSNVLGSTNQANITVTETEGWAKFTFAQNYASAVAAPLSSPAGAHTYTGLPTVGFMVQDFTNQNAAPGVMATYGGNFNHKYTTSILVPGGVPAVNAE